MLDAVYAAMRKIADEWKSDAAKRKKLTATDPVADALEYCADEVIDQIQTLKLNKHTLTVKEYADMKGKSPQTIRNWIHRGELDAAQVDGDFRIPSNAVRQAAAQKAS